MSDWDQFLHEVTWFLPAGESVVVGEARPWTRGSVDGLPELSALLGSAELTPVFVGGNAFELLAWGPSDDRRGWLCRPPRDVDSDCVTSTHRSFWRLCGGIVERFREPDSWWINQNEVLTVDAAHVPVAGVLADYAWLWEDHGVEIPINPDEYNAVAVEGNGNLTLAHRDDERLLLFAPDHAFANVTPLAGSPPYSLLTIDHVPDLAAWIEVCAAAWR
ncbi:hypothetical protein [Micromonospora auratinigra]|uniref:Uncharacterized protein n=1 Tax=Micromonospora auratinigra TaxID=261654 RepID=A0A1A8ZAA5_9ACTN|nr:hypothetical protein [Micromonospora auratinigra]SBT40765.1 hypothetical protein GA0070611_1382 [Micromonospora auratinigra]